jgi:hypothetical protein
MGGDGGVIASNRQYMRGAGTADKTGDYDRNDPDNKEHNALEAMTTCYLTKTPLFPSNKKSHGPIVACIFGRLYHKEAAVQALLTRRQASTTSEDSLGDHIRKLSDLYDVRFNREADTSKGVVQLICPITAKALAGIIPAILLVPGKPDIPNVLCASALQQLPQKELELEYGLSKKQIRLAPPPEMLKKIRQEELETKLQKKEKKKKKRKLEDGKNASHKKTKAKGTTTSATIHTATKSRVESAIQSNQVLSSLFTTTNTKKKSNKERNDGLFAR